MTENFADPLTVAAIAKARAAQTRALVRWTELRGVEQSLREELGEQSCEALVHLEGGRFDEAQACAEWVMSSAEALGHGPLWHDFGLQVEEAAETGFAAASLEGE